MGAIVLLDLMGGVALLLWGLHMIRSGILRAFGAAVATLCCRRLSATASPHFWRAVFAPPCFRAVRRQAS
jgi:hypothetical protein